MQVDADAALAFLVRLRPEGLHNLVAIDPDTRQVFGITRLLPEREQDLRQFIARHAKRNLYFTPNVPAATAPDRKLKKADIAAAEFLWIDCDPKPSEPFETERARLRSEAIDLRLDSNPPTFQLDSGGGYQHLWQVAVPLEEAEARNRGLARLHGGDHIGNVDRVLRLPGTINWPDKRKKDLGRKPAQTAVVADTEAAYDSPAFAPYEERQEPLIEDTEVSWEEARKFTEVTDLTPSIQTKLTSAIENDEHFATRWRGETEGLHDESRSGLAISIAASLKRHGFENQDIANALFANAHLKGADWTERELLRTVARASGSSPFDALTDAQLAKIEASSAKRQSTVADQSDSRDYLSFDHRTAYQGEPPKQRWLVENTIPHGIAMTFVGIGGIGKSMLLLENCLKITDPEFGDQTFLGGQILEHGSVLYLNAEDDEGVIHRRLARMDPDNARRAAPYALYPVPLMNLGGPDFYTYRSTKAEENKPALKRLRGILNRIPNLKAVVLDPLMAFTRSDVNKDPADARHYMQTMGTLAAEYGATFLNVHHMNKSDGLRARSIEQARAGVAGAAQIVDTGRASYVLFTPSDEDSHGLCRRMGLEYARGCIVFGGSAKINDGPLGVQRTFYRDPETGRLRDMTQEHAAAESMPVALCSSDRDRLFAEIESAWEAGMPWSTAPQTRQSGRYFPPKVADLLQVPFEEAKDIIGQLLLSGDIAQGVISSDSKLKGLKLTEVHGSSRK